MLDADSLEDQDRSNRYRYEQLMEYFECDVKALYYHGGKSFLTKTNEGDQENLYMHVLRYYIPIIVL